MNLTNLKNLFNHERYFIIAIIIVIIILLWMFGCVSTVVSLQDPDRKITRAELQNELDTIYNQAEIRFQQLDQQDEFKKFLLEKAILFAEGGTINPIGLVTAIAGILGVGATVDNVRKRKVIKRINSNGTNTA